MQKKGMIASGMSLAVLVLLVYTVNAVYIGPHRTETRTLWERRNCHYQAVYDPPGPGSFGCYLDQYIAPSSGCSSPSGIADYFNPTVCTSWPGSCTDLPCVISLNSSVGSCVSGQEGCVSRLEEYSLPEPVISGNPACALPGDNGWCRGGAVLNLAASEPLVGFSITSIEGSNGLACPGANCIWDFPEGKNVVSFWALSSYGDTSRESSSSMLVDSVAPTASLELSGSNIFNDWYSNVDELLVSVIGADDTSGVASLSVRLNDGTWIPSPASMPGEGEYRVTGRAVDNAGNETLTSSQLIRIDITQPTISITNNQNINKSNWYTSPVTVSATASDALSGVDTLTTLLVPSSGEEQGTMLPVTLNIEGLQTLIFTASDLAGNTTQLAREYPIDLNPPQIHNTVTGTPGENGWYQGPISVHFLAEDAASGVANFLIQAPDGAWVPAQDLDFQLDGVYPVSLSATDQAGWTATADLSFSLDQTPPSVSTYISGERSPSGWFTSPVTVRLEAEDILSGIAEISPQNEITLTDNGTYPLHWTVSDRAGNQTTYSLDDPVRIDRDPPILEIGPLTADLDGITLLSGSAADNESGLSFLELSTDGGLTFSAIHPAEDGVWTFSWDTALSPSGLTTLLLRGTDLAGNLVEVERLVTIAARLPAWVESFQPTLSPVPVLLAATRTPGPTATLLPTTTVSTATPSTQPRPTLNSTRSVDTVRSPSPSSNERPVIKEVNPFLIPFLFASLLLLFLYFSDPSRAALKLLATALDHFVQSHQKEFNV